jgi:large subunit ribosomal protein L3
MATRQGLLGKKIGMTRIFNEKGQVVPVTVIEVGPCYVTQIKTEAKDGYNAIQLGFGQAKRLNKAARGHLGELQPLRHLREIRTDNVTDFALGQLLSVGMFKVGEKVDVVGVSKGRGFAGVVKRHGFAGGPATRGQSDRQRHPGAIGASNTPGWVAKGMPMGGHMGAARVTVQSMRVVMVDAERNLLAIAGAVPGAPQGLVCVRTAVKQ